MEQPSLFDVPDGPEKPAAPDAPPDEAARRFAAAEPRHDVVLEASAGTGKTRVLVERYARLIEAGVEPAHILAITFTRKAAAEMRDRVLAALRARAADGAITSDRWRALQDRVADIQISTIDAFCFGLLREFPLEAGVEPGFDVADETEIGRFSREAMDLAIRASRGLLAHDEALRLLFARVKLPVLSRAVGALLDRRHLAVPAVATFVRQRAAGATAAQAASAFVERVRQIVARSPARAALLNRGPQGSPEYRWLHADLTALDTLDAAGDLRRVQQLRRRLERYFLTQAGQPRKKTAGQFRTEHFPSPAARKAHDEAVSSMAPGVAEALESLTSGINAVLARGLQRLLQIAVSKYEGLLEAHALLDFAGMLGRSVQLLERQEEFARSRLKLQSRYHHLLVDEFQDTSRLQWRLIELLIDAWGEGEGVADVPTSIFVVGDRKQSIYRFRHAEVTLLDEAARKITLLRPGRPVRQVITTSFRAVPELLAFVNALSVSIESDRPIAERFSYTDRDRFPVTGVAPGALRDGRPVLGLVAEPSMAACAEAVASEVERMVGHTLVRTRDGGPRPARPEDIAILFRSRQGHQYFETALESRGIRTYVYKGLGFFDAPEVQDVQALVRYLAQPDSDLRAAEFLRSRFVRLSDPGLVRLAPGFAGALAGTAPPAAIAALDPADQALLDLARQGAARWIAQADRVPPSELVDTALRDSAYVFEMRGRRLDQARENVKKVRGLIRRVESRGYATLGRIAEYFETLRAGDESNAILDASGAVNLMTMHAAKGLEFPIVFLVNLQVQGRGGGGGVRVIEQGPDGEPEVAFASTPGTALEDQRDDEELRRLLYVAATRARDRLILAAQIDARGQVRRGARSLASLLPSTLLAAFAQAAMSGADQVMWESAQGRFAFEVCRPAERAAVAPETEVPDAAPLDVEWLRPVGPVPVAATALSAQVAPPQAPHATPVGPAADAGLTGGSGAQAHERLVGTLVHRLFRRRLDGDADPDLVGAVAAGLIGVEERIDVGDLAAVATAAADLYLRLRHRPDVREALSAADQVWYEVPFSFAPPGQPDAVLRGVIDCLVLPPEGPPLVLEFKTGGPRPDHVVQVERYAEAVRAILALDRVETKILYA